MNITPQRLLAMLLAVLPLSTAVANAAEGAFNGDWRLQIEGRTQFFYGSNALSGGVRQDWRVIMAFRIEAGQFLHGSGHSELVGEAEVTSDPPGLFHCDVVHGDYLDRNLKMRKTPYLRFRQFPLSGQLKQSQLTLNPNLPDVGNLIAMMYHCEMQGPRGDFWLERAPIAASERGHHQGADTAIEGDHYMATVKDIRRIEPHGEITLPLIDGWEFRIEDQANRGWTQYRLNKIAD